MPSSCALEFAAATDEGQALCADPITPHEAIAILAGRPLAQRGPDSRERQRHYLRLVRAARAGALTSYLVGGSSRYSRADVKALRDSFARKSITTKPLRRRNTLSALAPQSYVSSVEAAKLAGVDPTTPPHWAKKGWYGARKIGGRWFFDREQIAARKKRAKPGPPVRVACAACGEPVERVPARLRQARRTYCPTCWPAAQRKLPERALAAYLAMDPDKRHKRLSDAAREARLRRPDPARIRAMNEAAAEMNRSPTRSVARGEAQVRAYGREATSEERQEWARRAQSRKSKGRAGRKRKTALADGLKRIVDVVLAGHMEELGTLKRAELLAEVGIRAWQENLGTLRRDFPANRQDPECYAPQWRRSVIARVGHHVAGYLDERLKVLQIARS